MPRASVTEAARPPKERFPRLPLPLPIPYPPMEATRAESLPPGAGWQFEPKWDGFRCLVFRAGDDVVLQSKAGQPLGRYFPELVAAFRKLKHSAFILDGEIVIRIGERLSFDDLLLRIHPAASRIAKLTQASPATFLAFDLLYEPSDGGRLLVELPLRRRRTELERFLSKAGITPVSPSPLIELCPSTTQRHIAEEWFRTLGPIGCDGVMAKKLDEQYHAGDREAMVKVKRLKTADCVVGGFRYTENGGIGSLLLGLYNQHGLLDHVGHTASFSTDERQAIKKAVEPLKGGPGFSGKAPGGPSRWSSAKSGEWEPVDPVLVCEVRYDYFTQQRFRHGTRFLRWRPEKDPKQCTLDQVVPSLIGKKQPRNNPASAKIKPL